jgi:methionyl aminopeptidase
VEYHNEYVFTRIHCPHVADVIYSTTSRITSAEKRELERLAQEDPSTTYQNIRRAAEVHRQVRDYARRTIKPGMSMTEIAHLIEDSTRALVEEDGLEAGVGFPTGLSVNEVAAHYTPNAGDTKSELEQWDDWSDCES